MHLYWIVFFTTSVMFYLWWLRYYLSVFEFFMPVLIVMLMINIYFDEGLSRVGLRPSSFRGCFSDYGEQLAGVSILLLWGIFMAGNLSKLINYESASFLFRYILVGFVQQYFVNGFLVNRLAGFYGNECNKNISLITGFIFGLIHLPNLFLMIVTGLGGYLCANIFLKYRNLYFNGLSHGVVAFLLFNAFPESITRHFAVGIKYFSN